MWLCKIPCTLIKYSSSKKINDSNSFSHVGLVLYGPAKLTVLYIASSGSCGERHSPIPSTTFPSDVSCSLSRNLLTKLENRLKIVMKLINICKHFWKITLTDLDTSIGALFVVPGLAFTVLGTRVHTIASDWDECFIKPLTNRCKTGGARTESIVLRY